MKERESGAAEGAIPNLGKQGTEADNRMLIPVDENYYVRDDPFVSELLIATKDCSVCLFTKAFVENWWLIERF